MKDTRRITILEGLKVNTLSVNTAQLYSRAALAEVAELIALRLGKRLRIRNKNFAVLHDELRLLLPRNAEPPQVARINQFIDKSA